MLLFVFVAIAGGFLTGSAMVSFGWAAAVLSAPLGGSLCAGVAALVIMRLRGPADQAEDDTDAQTNVMVAELRGILSQARCEEPELPEAERVARRA
ncbi:hypothetical protein ABZT49_28780 [Methylobacterium sp. EM32]|uniref:hypothetical protein n=1 Tax=Methylobacterium sp. EM32 TaxID=3163481 RepID=UPI0033A50C70